MTPPFGAAYFMVLLITLPSTVAGLVVLRAVFDPKVWRDLEDWLR